jgi:large subunit ribosomal protein L13
MIIDATDTIMGRLATYAAKKALLGENVEIVNAERAIISGNKKEILAKYQHRRVGRGTPGKGPFFPRQADKILKRTIRGMLPYKQEKGRVAMKRIRCHVGVPASLEGKEMTKVEGAHKSKLEMQKYLTLSKLAEYLGAK